MTASATKVRVVVAATLDSSFMGDPNALLERFGPWPTVLAATLARVAAAKLGPISLVYPATEANRELPIRFPAEPGQLEHHEGRRQATPPELALAVMGQAGAEIVLIVDGRCPFVSPTLLRQAADALAAQPNAGSVSFPVAAAGVGAIGFRRAALETIAHSSDIAQKADFAFDWSAYYERIRWLLSPLDLECDTKYQCVLSDLTVRTREDLARLEPFVPKGESEDYGVLVELAKQHWARLDPSPSLRRRTPSTKKRKILFSHYTTSRKPGSTTSFERMVDNWDHSKYEITIALPAKGELWDYLAGRFDLRLLPISWITGDREASPAMEPEYELADAFRFLEQVKPDVVFFSAAAPMLQVASRLLGIPSVCYSHFPYFVVTPSERRVMTRHAALTATDVLIGASGYMAERLTTLLRPPAGRVRVVHCGIPLERFRPIDRAAGRKAHNLPLDRPIVGIVGLLTKAKRPELAIRAMETVRKEVPNALLAIAGGERIRAGYDATLMKLIAELGLEDHVRLLGHVEAVHEVYAALDLLVHAALEEPFAQVIPEAMAMERPVIAFRTGGPAEIIIDGETGALIPPPGTPEALGAAIAGILGKPERAVQMGLAGRARAEKLFSAQRFVTELAAICDEVCQK